MKWSMQDIATVVVGNAGFTDDDKAAQAVAIAWAESQGDTDAVGDTGLQNSTWGPSIGLWQIRTLKNPKGEADQWRNRKNLEGNPQFQSLAMSAISNKGTNWGPWTTYNTGAYLIFLPQAKAAVAAARAGGATDMTGWDAGAAVGETIPGDKGDPLGAIGNLAGTVGDIAKSVGSIGDFLGKLTDPVFVQRAVKVAGGGTLLLAGLVILNRDLLGGAVKTAASFTPAGKVATVAESAVAAAS